MNRNELCPITVFTLEWAPPTNEWRTVLSDPKHNAAPIDFFCAVIIFNALTGKKEDQKLVCLFKQNKRKERM